MSPMRPFLLPRIRLLPWGHDHYLHPDSLYRISGIFGVFGAPRHGHILRKHRICVLGLPGNFFSAFTDAPRLQPVVVARFLDRSMATGRAEVSRARLLAG